MLFLRGVFLVVIPILFMIATYRTIRTGYFILGRGLVGRYKLTREEHPGAFWSTVIISIAFTVIATWGCGWLLFHPEVGRQFN